MNTTPTTESASQPIPVGWRWAPIWVLAFVAMWPIHAYAELVLVLGALTTIAYLLLTRFRGGHRLLSARAWALTSALFTAYWLPQLLSLIGAVDQARVLHESLVDLRYLPFLWLAAAAVADPRGRKITFGGLVIIVLAWSTDALIEAVSGTSPLFWGLDQIRQLISGRPFCGPDSPTGFGHRIGGIFGPCNVKLGVVLASLSPFALYAATRRFGTVGWMVSAMLVGIAIILSGMRAAWITYALVLLFSGWQLLGWKKAMAALLASMLTLTVLGLAVPFVGQRLASTSQALEGNLNGVDAALSGRLRVWSAALCMIGEHPVNGVGSRGFRTAFPACDPTPQAASWGEGPAFHAHQIVLEIATETGILGLILWLGGAVLAWRAWCVSSRSARAAARPAMLALALTVFPFNTHLAFYSTMWGGLTLLLAALYAGSLFGHHDRLHDET